VSLTAHESARSKSTDWLTPPEIVEALGPFYMDPCASPDQPWATAVRHLTVDDDGLAQTWSGRVWLNPPFGREAEQWIRRMAIHGRGTALLPARTETSMWFRFVWGVAEAVCFLRGRPHFCHPNGQRASFNSGTLIALIAYSAKDDAHLRMAQIGWTVRAK